MQYTTIAVAALSLASGASAFSIAPACRAPRSSVLRMAEEEAPKASKAAAAAAAAAVAPKGMMEVKEQLWSPDQKADIRIEGGSTLKTFKLPAHSERVQYIITSPNGRPPLRVLAASDRHSLLSDPVRLVEVQERARVAAIDDDQLLIRRDTCDLREKVVV